LGIELDSMVQYILLPDQKNVDWLQKDEKEMPGEGECVY
jgi:hypothetical protein